MLLQWGVKCACTAAVLLAATVRELHIASCAGGTIPNTAKGRKAAYASAIRSGNDTAHWKAWRVVEGSIAGSIAQAKYVDARVTSSGFGQLHISTLGVHQDVDQVYAAGLLEGWLSAERIHDYYVNTHSYFLNQLGASLKEPVDWLERQDTWARRQVLERDTTFYQVLGLVLAQFDGLVAGYHMRHSVDPVVIPFMSRRDFVFLNGNGELYDLIARQPQMPDLAKMAPHELFVHVALAGRCSALATVSPDLGELLIGHSTWDSYSQIVRLFKHFHFNLTQPGVAAQQLSYSSYAGEVYSDDDLYMMDSGLTVVSTTNKVFNLSLYDQLTEASLVSWQRVRVANFMSKTGEEWVAHLREKNSGTYNNNYMIIDVGKFTAGQELPQGLLWVAEQLPGLIVAGDMTSTLARGYYAAYNIPVFPEIYDVSGLRAFRDELVGEEFRETREWLSYQLTPRAEIFRCDHGKANNLAGMQRLMRSNTFLSTDKLAGHNPMAAVCARGDLDAQSPHPKGCFDTKVSSAALARRLEAYVIAGPTTQDGIPPFRWTPAFDNVEHRGQPEVFDHQSFERQAPDMPAFSQHATSTV